MLLYLLGLVAVWGMNDCPYMGEPPLGHPPVRKQNDMFQQQVEKIDFKEVSKFLKDNVLRKSMAFWPADYGNYGPLFIRLAWHCAGSYRASDGRGGCDGGHIRFDPERSWPDNTNLDKARRLLVPVKKHFGPGLSWGDLFVLAGTAAIEDMGGPILGFCGGRVDNPDGKESLPMGPSEEQRKFFPCDDTKGECGPETLLGSIHPGAIYVNPGGVGGNPVPAISAGSVREVFARMDFNDSETVAICGGGHAFGKAHGACLTGPGPNPAEQPFNPWPGTCMPKKKEEDTFTSGWEGAWTINPDKWDNNYFVNLVKYDWQTVKSPGGNTQWIVKGMRGQAPDPKVKLVAPDAHVEGKDQDVMMFTSDLAFMHDPLNLYQPIVKDFAENQKSLDNMFAYAWYKLMTRDMGPVDRCVGNMVPPAQDWQNPLPAPPAKLADFDEVRKDLELIINIKKKADKKFGAQLVQLAYQCASTYRQTDHRGGCNGARIRFSPEKDWQGDGRLGSLVINKLLDVLKFYKLKYGPGLSWADLIVLAGSCALEDAGSLPMDFCPGRTDAMDGKASKGLGPVRVGGGVLNFLVYKARQMGLTEREYAALVGGNKAMMTSETGELSNKVFIDVLKFYEMANLGEKTDMPDMYKALYADTAMLDASVDFAADNAYFIRTYSEAYTKMMNADRFDGPMRNKCTKPKVQFPNPMPDPCMKFSENPKRCRRRMCYYNEKAKMCMTKSSFMYMLMDKSMRSVDYDYGVWNAEESTFNWYVVLPVVASVALLMLAYKAHVYQKSDYTQLEAEKPIMAA